MTRWGYFRPVPVKNLSRHLYRKQKQLRNRVVSAINKGMPRQYITNHILLPNKAKDLSAKCGELILFEYCEEFPPILSQIGMASNVKIYIKPKSNFGIFPLKVNKSIAQNSSEGATGDKNPNKHPKGNCKIGFDQRINDDKLSKRLYFNEVSDGSSQMMIENNLYRAPIYEHKLPSTDFLIIRTRSSMYVRPARIIFTVGQTMPIETIHGPSDQSIQKFRCDLSNLHIHRLFRESTTEPPSIRYDDLIKMFPDYSRGTLSRRLKIQGAVSGKLNGVDMFFRGRSNYGQVPLHQLRRAFTPEDYCKSMSCLAARQRLRELNYTESMIYPPSNDIKLEPEVLAAPWNVSKAIMDAFIGRSFLNFKDHLIDPSGQARKEGFSCVTWHKSPIEEEQMKERRASGCSQSNRQGSNSELPLLKNPLADKIRREKLERLNIYRREAQLIGETQSRVLSSAEVISSSEDDENEDEDDNEDSANIRFEEQLSDLDRLVLGNRTVSELSREREEEERKRMLTDIRTNGRLSENEPTTGRSRSASNEEVGNRILRITRVYPSKGGTIERTEIIREPGVIALYVKIRGGQLSTPPRTAGTACKWPSSGVSKSTREANSSTARPTGRRRLSLGPSEMCRADGTVVTISKKVLDSVRSLRVKSNISMAE